jgi:pantoate kinase
MTPASVTAFCPGHISGYFRRIDGHDPAATGSIGAGIVIDSGVTATVRPAATCSIIIKKTGQDGVTREAARESPPLHAALDKIDAAVDVVTECQLPIGAGFGLSAAALLATLTAVNRLNETGLRVEEIAGIAHETEVIFRTGLGDVAACQGGGRVVRTGAGIRGPIERHFDLPEPVFALSFGPIHTPAVLGSPAQMARVAAAFPSVIPENAGDFFRLSREFADQSGLETPEVKGVLAACDREYVPASMTMLGNGIFAYGRAAEPVLRSFGEVHELHMARSGVRILEVRG